MTIHFHSAETPRCRPEHGVCGREMSNVAHYVPLCSQSLTCQGDPISCDSSEVTCGLCLKRIVQRVEAVLLNPALLP